MPIYLSNTTSQGYEELSDYSGVGTSGYSRYSGAAPTAGKIIARNLGLLKNDTIN